jgi:hypothetical protein
MLTAYYVLAAQLKEIPRTYDPSKGTVPIPVPNAFDVYYDAIGKMPGGTTLLKAKPLYLGGVVDADRIKEVDRLQRSIGVIKSGIKCGYMEPVGSFHYPPGPYVGAFNMLGIVLLASGDVKASKGDIKGAFQDYNDLYAFGSQLQDSGKGLMPLIGVSLQDAARGSLWTLRDKLTTDQLADTGAMLKEKATGQRGYPRILGSENLNALLSWRFFFKSVYYAPRFYSMMKLDPTKPPPGLGARDLNQMKPADKARVCNQLFRGWIDRAQNHPFPSRGSEPTFEEVVPEKDPVNKFLAVTGALSPALSDGYRYVIERNQAANGGAAGAFALAAYMRTHTTLPKSMNDFGIDLLSHLPADPFMPTKYMKAVFTPTEVTFYSVGPWGLVGDAKGTDKPLRADLHGDVNKELDTPGRLVWVVPLSEVKPS